MHRVPHPELCHFWWIDLDENSCDRLCFRERLEARKLSVKAPPAPATLLRLVAPLNVLNHRAFKTSCPGVGDKQCKSTRFLEHGEHRYSDYQEVLFFAALYSSGGSVVACDGSSVLLRVKARSSCK